jgi:hypothetical protein
LNAGFVRVDARAFQELRVAAETEARELTVDGEATIAEIHRLLALNLGITNSNAEALLRMELDIEASLIVPIPCALEIVNSARRWSPGVLFASDMYLPCDFIRDQLKSHGFWRDGDELYVSNEWRASKANGRLFPKILENERLQAESLLHTGDRRRVDFELPSGLGIKARHVDVCGLTRYEQILEEFSGESLGFTSLVAGTSRLARLQKPAATKHLSVLTEIASSLISPVIVFYAIWLIREAKERRVTRLYFVARDGYLVKRIVDALIRVLGLQLETRYLYGSRQAWHIPAITELSDESVSWLFERTRTLNLRIVLGRLQMIPEQITGILDGLGWPQHTWDEPLGEEALGRVKTKLLSSRDFCGEVKKLVAGKRDMALCYLEQEGLFDAVPFAIVDLGWHGRLQQSLERLLSVRRPTPTLGLYFGLYGDSAAVMQLKTASYLGWDLRQTPESKDVPSLVFLMESFFTAPHGSTIGYRRESNGRISPICRDEGIEQLEKWGLSTVHAAVDTFARNLEGLTLSEEMLAWDSRCAVLRILGAFSKDPLAAEARAWGSFPYEDEQAGTVHERLTAAYELTWENLQIALTFGDERFLPASWKVLWHGGQKHVLTGENMLLKLALRLGKLKRKLGSRLRKYRRESVSKSHASS